MDNIYVYDKKTGRISYSIDGATPEKIEAVKNRGMSFIVLPRCNILNNYVIEEAGVAVRTEKVQNFEINLNKESIFADGEDEVIFSNIPEDTNVYINGGQAWTSNSTDITFGFSVDGFEPKNPIIEFKKYGYNNFKTAVKTLLSPNAFYEPEEE